MKNERIILIVALVVIYLDSIFDIAHNELHVSQVPLFDLFITLYHAILFLFVSYYLIPKYFYTKKYLHFFLFLSLSIILFTFLEEGVLEKTFVREERGNDEVSIVSIYFFIGEIIVPLLAFVAIKFFFDNLRKEKRIEQIQKDQLSNELKFLKSQIQPHILFNSLNSIYDFTLAKSDKAPEMVLELSNVLRYVLYETIEEKVTLIKELDFLKDYIALQTAQLEGRGEVNFQQEDLVDSEQLTISPFLLIPFIENSFKHSLQTKERGILINIKIEVDQSFLILNVENNYEDLNLSNNLLIKGIGLKNVEKRLELLYSDRYELEIVDQDKWYRVNLKINLAI